MDKKIMFGFLLLFILLVVFSISFLFETRKEGISKVEFFEKGKKIDKNVSFDFYTVLKERGKECVVTEEDVVNDVFGSENYIYLKLNKPIKIKNRDFWEALLVFSGKFKGDLIFLGDMPFCFKIKKEYYKPLENSLSFFDYNIKDIPPDFIGRKYFYDEKTKTLYVYLPVNCCGIELDVETKLINRHDFEKRIIFIIEKKVGELCKCFGHKLIEFKNVNINDKVVYVRFDGKSEVLLPSVNVGGFCGISTFGECETDEDCVISGCSEQVCKSKKEEIYTSCEWFDCYDKEKYPVECRCVEGKCRWTKK